jgi:lactate dehydrogenase-like 2-hydroxyacid dehydrogenase
MMSARKKSVGRRANGLPERRSARRSRTSRARDLFRRSESHRPGGRRRAKFVIFNTSGVLEEAVAETAMFLTWGASRWGMESIKLVRRGAWRGWTATQLIGVGLTRRTMGIFGMGEIGRRVAALPRGFGMETVYYHPSRAVEGESSTSRWISDPAKFIRQCAMLLMAAPSMPETRRIRQSVTMT